jgi:hypothetical protein
MKPNKDRKQSESAASWERATSRASDEMLAILAPSAEEPRALLRAGIWKTGPADEPIRGAA